MIIYSFIESSYLARIDQLDKFFKRTVICAFYVIGEKTGGAFSHFQMITDTITAISFSGAGFVTAIAIFKISFMIAVHKSPFGFVNIFINKYN